MIEIHAWFTLASDSRSVDDNELAQRLSTAESLCAKLSAAEGSIAGIASFGTFPPTLRIDGCIENDRSIQELLREVRSIFPDGYGKLTTIGEAVVETTIGIPALPLSAAFQPRTESEKPAGGKGRSSSNVKFAYDYDSDLFMISAAADAKDWIVTVRCEDGQTHTPKPSKFTPYPGCDAHEGRVAWLVEYYKPKTIEIQRPDGKTETLKHPDA